KCLKGLTVGVDYYHVTEDNLPVADAQSAANSLSTLGTNSPYASGFSTADGTAFTNASQVTVDNWNNLVIPWTGAQRLRTEGLDLSLNYVLPLDEKIARVTLGSVAHV